MQIWFNTCLLYHFYGENKRKFHFENLVSFHTFVVCVSSGYCGCRSIVITDIKINVIDKAIIFVL